MSSLASAWRGRDLLMAALFAFAITGFGPTAAGQERSPWLDNSNAPAPQRQQAFDEENAEPDDTDADADAEAGDAGDEEEVQAEPQAPAPGAADANFDSLMLQQNFQALPPAARAPSELIANEAPSSTAEVPLGEYTAVRDRLNELRQKNARQRGPAVVLGAAVYEGEAREGALALTGTLQVTLGEAERWKIVPLVGDGVIIAAASAGGEPLPITRMDGYYVWVTKKSGEVTVQLSLLVPQRGRRGSIEYDFVVSRTPVTHFSCRFPVPGLEPRIDAAVQSEVRTQGGSTLLSASLQPTTRIHLVGFRDLGETETAQEKLYAETSSLLSIEESGMELFSVIRYTILYAGAKSFHVLVPPGVEVVSADGEGAFRYELETSDKGTLIKGETAYPIRDNYEISVRLHREMKKGSESFTVPLPKCVGVEREQGWLAVEVPGKLKLEEQGRAEALEIDVRLLPGEMLQSAVSPILKAYRYHTPDARVQLMATSLPGREPASNSVDQIRAVSVLSPDGKTMTDLRITLRNRLRPSLAMTLPEGAIVRSTLLDGEPVKPSQAADGRLTLPLKRSAGQDRLQPFTLQVTLEGGNDTHAFIGHSDLSLPSLDLPVSSLAWTLYLPPSNVYSRIRGDIDAQDEVGVAEWYQPRELPVMPGGPRAEGLAAPEGGHTLAAELAASADTGAMPVRFRLEESGTQVGYTRYWIGQDQPVRVSFFYMRRLLRGPIVLLLLLVVAAALFWIYEARRRTGARSLPSQLGALAVALLIAVPLIWLGGGAALFVAVMIAAVAVAWRAGAWARLFAAVKRWQTDVVARWRARPARDKAPSVGKLLWRIAIAWGLGISALVVFFLGLKVLALLFNPLP